MRAYRIALIGGDGTGPEVLREGVKVVDAAAKRCGFKLDTSHYDLGGDRYLETGDLVPDSILEEFRGQDAIFLGAIGHPDVKPGILEKGILLHIRFELDQYINFGDTYNPTPLNLLLMVHHASNRSRQTRLVSAYNFEHACAPART